MIGAAVIALAMGQAVSAKMIVVLSDQPVVIEYPTMERCDRARRYLQSEIQTRAEAAQRDLPPGAILTRPALAGTAVCIPG
jgi:hypothetical protein